MSPQAWIERERRRRFFDNGMIFALVLLIGATAFLFIVAGLQIDSLVKGAL